MLLLHLSNAATLDARLCTMRKVPISAGLILSALLLCVWGTGCAIVLTIFGPFTTTSNGYFACWAALASNLLLLGECAPASAAEVGDRASAAVGKLTVGSRPYVTPRAGRRRPGQRRAGRVGR